MEMTEAEIMKALECCIIDGCTCTECPYEYTKHIANEEFEIMPNGKSYDDLSCDEWLKLDLFDLINRKNAEIEHFADIGKMYSEIKAEARAEAIKEFAERLGSYWLQFVIDEIREFAAKSGLDPVYSFNPTEKELNVKYKDILEYIDQIAKEMGVE